MHDFKRTNQWRLNHETNKVNNAVKHFETKNSSRTNNLIKAGSRIVAGRLGLRTTENRTVE